MSSKPVLEVVNVSKRFTRGLRQSMRYAGRDILRQLFLPWRPENQELRPDEFWALRNVSFSLKPGESIGILGKNGAGKSTLLRLITGIFKPTTGTTRVSGRMGAIVELGSAFAPNLSGLENLRPQALMHGYTPELLRRQFDRIVEFADLGDFINQPVRYYSTGMRARLGFAVASHGEPDILVVDEVLAVGDLNFQNKCIRLVNRFREGGGAVVYVGHNSVEMQAACKRGIVLERGQVVFEGSIVDALDQYCNPVPAHSTARVLSPADTLPPGHPNTGQIHVIASRVSYHPNSTDCNMGSAIIDLTICVYEDIPALRFASAIFFGIQPHPLIFTLSDTVSLFSGTHRITLKIPTLRLLPDDYLIRLTLIDDHSSFPLWTKGWQDAPLPFRVTGGPTRISNLARLVSARVELDCQVSIQEITSVECEKEITI